MTESIKEIIEWWEELDCRDHSCLFAKEKKGMRSNGGCRCLNNNRARVSKHVRITVSALKTCIEALHSIKDDGVYNKYLEAAILRERAQEALKSIGYLKE